MAKRSTEPNHPRAEMSEQQGGVCSAEDIERAVLGAILEDNSLLKDALENLTVDDFALAFHQLLARTFLAFSDEGKPINVESVSEHLRDNSAFVDAYGESYLTGLMIGVLTDAKHQRHNLQILNAYATRRWEQSTLEQSLDRSNDPYELLDRLSHELNQRRKGRDRQDNVVADPGDSRWKELKPLGGEFPAVITCDADMLPEIFRDLVTDISHRLQTPPDFAAASGVCTLAGAVNRRAVLQCKALDKSWNVVPNLWGLLIGPPGSGRSPVMNMMVKPLACVQGDWYEQYDRAVMEHQRAAKRAELDQRVWEEQYKRSKKAEANGKVVTLPEQPEDSLVAPVRKRLITNDTTGEAVHKLLCENPAGLFVPRDEISGFLAELDKPGRQGERQFHLTCWNGDQGYTYDRIREGRSLHAKYCCTSMLGCLPPARLRSYLNDVIEDAPGNDGLMQRFQVSVYPDLIRDYEYIDCEINQKAFDRLVTLFSDLTALDAESPLRFRFADDAQELFADWLVTNQRKARNPELHPALQSHLAKFDKLMASSALLFELADRGFNGVLSMKHTQQAINCCAYLESHARRMYACIISPERRAAELLGRRIKEGWKRSEGTFTLRDVYGSNWRELDDATKARNAIEILIDAGWIRRIDTGKGTGRPSEVFAINPKLGATKC